MTISLIYLNLIRLVHVFGGVLWAGSAIFYLFFVKPSVKAIGPAGPKFIQELIEKRRYSQYMGGVSLLTGVSGLLLYWNTSGGLNLNWVKTGPGLGFTIGAVIAFAVFLLGLLVLKPRAERLGALGKEIGMAGGSPNPQQKAEFHGLEKSLAIIEWVDVSLLAVALVAMATARYWVF